MIWLFFFILSFREVLRLTQKEKNIHKKRENKGKTLSAYIFNQERGKKRRRRKNLLPFQGLHSQQSFQLHNPSRGGSRRLKPLG